MKKNFLFVSFDALITDTAWQVVKEGHNVKFSIDDKSCQDIGNGFIPKTKNWRAELDWADIVIFDDVLGHGKLAEKLRKTGKLVVGGTKYTDRLEDDRSFGQKELLRHGIKVLPYQEFNYFDDAIKFVKDHPGAYVIKPSGEAQNIKKLLFVGQDDNGDADLSMKNVGGDTKGVFGILVQHDQVYFRTDRREGCRITFNNNCGGDGCRYDDRSSRFYILW